jgi:hypothetical protein
MKQRRRPPLLLAAGLVSLALAGGWAASARADVAYGFAEQTITNLTIAPAITATTTVATTTSASTTVNGSGVSNSNPLDTPEAYQGGSPPAPQNDYTRYAPGATPVSPVGNFTRGDAVISSLAPTANSSSVVAESYLNGVGQQNETGHGALAASLSFTIPTTSALTISYGYANDLYVFTTGLGNATANYHFNISIKDSMGNVVFSSSTPATNLSLTAPPPGGEVIRTGTESVTTPSLTAGTLYSITFSSTADTSVTIAAVPELDAMTMVGASGALALVVGKVRRRALRKAAK